jgi:hypothetical protein
MNTYFVVLIIIILLIAVVAAFWPAFWQVKERFACKPDQSSILYGTQEYCFDARFYTNMKKFPTDKPCAIKSGVNTVSAYKDGLLRGNPSWKVTPGRTLKTTCSFNSLEVR